MKFAKSLLPYYGLVHRYADLYIPTVDYRVGQLTPQLIQ